MQVLYLSRKDVNVAGGSDLKAIIDLVEEAFRLHQARDISQPPGQYLRIPSDREGKRIIAMPAYLGGRFKAWGLKWIASVPSNPFRHNIERASAVLILNDIETGVPIAIMEGALISASRTAAVAALATRYLASRDTATVGILGAGFIAKAVVKGLQTELGQLREINVYDLSPHRAEAFKKEVEAQLGANVSIKTNPHDVVVSSKTVVTATTTATPYIEGDWLSDGTLLLNISLRDPKPSVVIRSNKIVVDDWAESIRENTVLCRMVEEGLLSQDSVYAELGEIIARLKPGRENEEEIIFFNPMGLAIEDVAVATYVYANAKRNNVGTYLDFC